MLKNNKPSLFTTKTDFMGNPIPGNRAASKLAASVFNVNFAAIGGSALFAAAAAEVAGIYPLISFAASALPLIAVKNFERDALSEHFGDDYLNTKLIETNPSKNSLACADEYSYVYGAERMRSRYISLVAVMASGLLLSTLALQSTFNKELSTSFINSAILLWPAAARSVTGAYRWDMVLEKQYVITDKCSSDGQPKLSDRAKNGFSRMKSIIKKVLG